MEAYSYNDGESVGAGVGLCGVGTLASPASCSLTQRPTPQGDGSVPTSHPPHSRPYKIPRYLFPLSKTTSEKSCPAPALLYFPYQSSYQRNPRWQIVQFYVFSGIMGQATPCSQAVEGGDAHAGGGVGVGCAAAAHVRNL